MLKTCRGHDLFELAKPNRRRVDIKGHLNVTLSGQFKTTYMKICMYCIWRTGGHTHGQENKYTTCCHVFIYNHTSDPNTYTEALTHTFLAHALTNRSYLTSSKTTTWTVAPLFSFSEPWRPFCQLLGFLNGSKQDLTLGRSGWGQWYKGSTRIYLPPLSSSHQVHMLKMTYCFLSLSQGPGLVTVRGG